MYFGRSSFGGVCSGVACGPFLSDHQYRAIVDSLTEKFSFLSIEEVFTLKAELAASQATPSEDCAPIFERSRRPYNTTSHPDSLSNNRHDTFPSTTRSRENSTTSKPIPTPVTPIPERGRRPYQNAAFPERSPSTTFNNTVPNPIHNPSSPRSSTGESLHPSNPYSSPRYQSQPKSPNSSHTRPPPFNPSPFNPLKTSPSQNAARENRPPKDTKPHSAADSTNTERKTKRDAFVRDYVRKAQQTRFESKQAEAELREREADAREKERREVERREKMRRERENAVIRERERKEKERQEAKLWEELLKAKEQRRLAEEKSRARRKEEARLRAQTATFASAPVVFTYEHSFKFYEMRWNHLHHLATGKADDKPLDTNCPTSLRFSDVPWPVIRRVRTVAGQGTISLPITLSYITPRAIRDFLLSPMHSSDLSQKQRLRAAHLLWHPDKFDTKVIGRVAPADVEMVREGCMRVVRVLNDKFQV